MTRYMLWLNFTLATIWPGGFGVCSCILVFNNIFIISIQQRKIPDCAKGKTEPQHTRAHLDDYLKCSLAPHFPQLLSSMLRYHVRLLCCVKAFLVF